MLRGSERVRLLSCPQEAAAAMPAVAAAAAAAGGLLCRGAAAAAAAAGAVPQALPVGCWCGQACCRRSYSWRGAHSPS